jgi:hypothetical protein
MRTLLLGLVVPMIGCADARAEPPPYQKEIAAWADAAKYKLGAYKNCTGIEEQYFGAMGSVCWFAKSSVAQTKGSTMYPRVYLTLAVYETEDKAKQRMASFRTVPKGVDEEGHKSYPLRAGFRLGSRVLVVTTDAFAFEPETYRAAAELAKATGGTELTCWTKCPP